MHLAEFAMRRYRLICLWGCPVADSLQPHVVVGDADGRRLVTRCESCGGERTAWPSELPAGHEIAASVRDRDPASGRNLNGFHVTWFAKAA
jgi:hypothetical protein